MMKDFDAITASLPSFSHAYARIEEKATKQHPLAFAPLKEKLQGNKVAIVAGGPTADFYEPLDGVIHVGINNSFLRDNVIYDYYFLNDALNYQIKNLMIYGNNNCIKYRGVHIEEVYMGSCVKLKDFNEYYVRYHGIGKNIFTKDVDIDIILYSPTTVMSVMQILLWCEPETIYLVGTDCRGGWYAGNNYYDQLTYDWRLLGSFAAKFYPQVKIVSVNPRGLKDLFPQIFQNEAAVRALDCKDAGDSAGAAQEARHALEISPENEGLKFLLLDALIDAKQAKEADSLLNKWLDLKPEWDNGWLKKGQMELNDKKWQDAEICARKALEINKANVKAPVLLLWALYYQDNKKWQDAFSSLPHQDAVRSIWAKEAFDAANRAIHNDNNVDAGIAFYKRALIANPDEEFFRTQLLHTLRATRKYAEAQEYATEGLRRNRKWVDGYRHLGWLAQIQNNNLAAYRYFAFAVRLMPYSFGSWRCLPEIWRKLGKTNIAHKYVAEILACMPNEPEPYYWQSRMFLAEKKPAQAEAAARKSVELLPPQEIGYRLIFLFNLVNLLKKAKRYDEALKWLEVHFPYEPQWVAGYIAKSELLVAKGRDAEATAAAEEAFRINPADMGARLRLCECLLEQRKRAETLLREGIRQNAAWDAGARLLWQIGDEENGLKKTAFFGKLARDFPHNLVIMSNYLELIKKLGPNVAIKEYVKSLRNNPKWAVGWKNLGMLYLDAKRLEQAQVCVRRAIELSPDDKWILVASARISIAANKMGDAWETLLKLRQKYPDWAITWREVARFHEAAANYDSALDYILTAMSCKDDRQIATNECLNIARRARNKFPKKEAYFFKSATLCEKLKKYDEAIGHLKKCLEFSPKNRTYKRRIKNIYKKTKNYREYFRFMLKNIF